MPLRKIVNLGKLFGLMIKDGSISLSFLKKIDFEETPSKNERLLVNIALDQIFNDSNPFETIKLVFGKL